MRREAPAELGVISTVYKCVFPNTFIDVLEIYSRAIIAAWKL
jgi:hypothetical protein